MTYSQTGSATKTTLFVLLGVCAFLAVAIMLLPKGFNDDLSIIGKGMPAVVLVHDKGSMGSLNLMELLNKVRPDYADKVEFIVVNINSKEGIMFREKQKIDGIVLAFFNRNGVKRGTFANSNDEAVLRSELNKLLPG